jgi:hypothetical protein
MATTAQRVVGGFEVARLANAAIAQDWRTDSNRPTAGARWLTGGSTCEPHRRKPRAMAINPVRIQSCCTAEIAHLLVPKRSFLAGLI